MVQPAPPALPASMNHPLGEFNVNVLARRAGQVERSSSGMTKSEAQKQSTV